MKKILFLLVFLAGFGSANAQCPTISGPAVLVVGTNATFSVTSGSAQCADCYDWDFTGSATIVGSDQNNTFTITPTATGTVSVCVNYITEGGCVDCCKDFSTCNIPSVNFAFSKITSPDNYWLAATPINASYTYYWEVEYSDGTILPYYGANVYDITTCYNDFGLVSITLKITSAGCPGGKTKKVNYYDYPDDCSTRRPRTGVLPNPAHDMLNLQMDMPIQYTVSILDTNGNLMKTFTEKDGKQLNISSLKKGIYIVRITDGERKEIFIDKIVKE